MSRTIADPRFRAVLASLLVQAGRSQRVLAREAHVSASYLSEIVNGQKVPSVEIAAAIDAALDAGGQLVDLIALAVSDEDREQLAAAAANPQPTPTVVDSLARVLAGQRLLDDTMGSAALLRPVAAQLPTITTMVAYGRGPHRQPALHQAAQWAQFAGWLHLATADWNGARKWLGRALEWATEADDPDLLATVLSYQGHLAWLTLQWPSTIGLARAALRDERVYPGQRAYDAYQAARAHAALNELDDARKMLAFGDDLAVQVADWTGEVPVWQYYRHPWLWSLERGLVWLYAARHDQRHAEQAVDDLQAGVDGMPAEMRAADWAAEYLTHLASAHIRAGDTAAAAQVLVESRSTAESTKSSRVLRMVADQERRLRVSHFTI